MKFAEKQTIQFMKLDHQIFQSDEGSPLEESEMEALISLIRKSMNIQECVFDIQLAEFLEYQSEIAQLQVKQLIVRIQKDLWFPDLENTEFEFNGLFTGEVQLICENAERDENKKLLTVNNCQYLAQLATRLLLSYPNTQGLSIDEGVQGSEIVQTLLDSSLNELQLNDFQKLHIVIRNTKKSDFHKKLISFQKQSLKYLDLELKTALPGEADELLYLLEHSPTPTPSACTAKTISYTIVTLQPSAPSSTLPISSQTASSQMTSSNAYWKRNSTNPSALCKRLLLIKH
ncbi:hypothetical protein FGO68_gene3464 [Halteria grandinella]|uniref:Uncharacterized protein n=1 Tax=Halteria grandinella TaxID=5974 RepID=A0A8J8T4I3_HALGN|nr:hypothetical protein FGO68_gene3464 [Halteria grandinella]